MKLLHLIQSDKYHLVQVHNSSFFHCLKLKLQFEFTLLDIHLTVKRNFETAMISPWS